MSEVEKLLERQTRWQRSRKELPWPEKVRMVQQIRDSVLGWCPAVHREEAVAGEECAASPTESFRDRSHRFENDRY